MAGTDAPLHRGDLVTVALQGDAGKPRPALVAQSDLFDLHPSVVIIPVTSELREAPLFRLRVQPDERNGLRALSDLMIDKPQTVRRERIGSVFGSLSAEQMVEVNRALALFLGLA